MPSVSLDQHAPPSMIGPFRIIRQLGRGGSSTVYLGERVDSFAQRVAIKLLYENQSTAVLDSEHRLLSSLDHTHIVRLLDQGIAEGGRRYLVMEFVDGMPVDRYCDAHQLTISARIQLLMKVMRGLDYAHRRMIIHADLKPSNILVDAQGEPKLLDFGIASSLGTTSADRDVETSQFTPTYASPEQKLGRSLGVASDVYSLGVVVAVLLAGIAPDGGPDRTLSRHLKRLNGSQLQGLADARSTNKSALIKTMAGDLDAVLGKALQAAPEERYVTVAAFKDDLKNYLEGRPVLASPATASVRLQKWVWRHWLVASLSAALLIALGLSAAGVAVQTSRAAHQRRVARTQLQDLVRLTGELDGELFDSVRTLAASDAAKKTLLLGAAKTLDRLAADDAGDPEVAVGVARQYQRLAQSWLSVSDSPGDSIRHAAMDVDRAMSVLDKLPERSRTSTAVQRQRSELLALKSSLKR